MRWTSWTAIALLLLAACDADDADAPPAELPIFQPSADEEGQSPEQSTDDTTEPSAEPPVDEDPEPPLEEEDPGPPLEEEDPEPPVEEPGPDCPIGVVCVDALPAVLHGSTRDAPQRHLDRYGCAPEVDESGPEVLYRVDVPESGFLALRLSGLDHGVDVDVHLLSAPAEDACLDRGHWTAGAAVEPGRYWVSVDTYVEGAELAGEYTLEIALTTAADLAEHGLDAQVAARGLHVFGVAWAGAQTDRFEYAISDFEVHSAARRQWIVDLATGELLWHLHVAHGRGYESPEDATAEPEFSNVPESHMSSLGLMRAAESYTGDYGYSFRLDGLEPGFNDNVRRRDIVMHPWEGSRPEYVAEHGLTRPTWGCPAIDDRVSTGVVDALSEGALMWFWYPDGVWSEGSTYLP